jgi:pimeloyl-ACP methyl ester carboxylesterase
MKTLLPGSATAFIAAALALHGPLVHGADMDRAVVAGGEIEYEVRGKGEPVLLIHGSHVADSFFPLMDQPALDDYQLIRYRRRGYAGSTSAQGPLEDYVAGTAADAAALLDKLEIDRAHVVGHSAGGVIALQLAMDQPERVGSLALLEPALLMLPSVEKVAERLEPAVEQYEAGEPAAGVDAFMSVVAGTEWREAVSAKVPGGVAQAKADAATFFELELPALMEWQFDEGKAEAIDHPLLYLWGGESGAVIGVEDIYREGRDQVKSWFPQTEEHYIEGVHHALQMQDPQAVAEGIAQFLKRHPLPVDRARNFEAARPSNYDR